MPFIYSGDTFVPCDAQARQIVYHNTVVNEPTTGLQESYSNQRHKP